MVFSKSSWCPAALSTLLCSIKMSTLRESVRLQFVVLHLARLNICDDSLAVFSQPASLRSACLQPRISALQQESEHLAAQLQHSAADELVGLSERLARLAVRTKDLAVLSGACFRSRVLRPDQVLTMVVASMP